MKILVLDMSPMARRIIRDELLASNFEILEADSPAMALEILGSTPDISLITTAISLGEMDGFEFLDNLRSDEVCTQLKPLNNHQVPAIFVTSNDTDEDRLKGFKVGAADFIQKPWTRGKLTEHIESALGQSDELHGMQVLVVDDSPTARVFIQVCLQRLGVTIHMADDGTSALEFLQNNKVDLVLTDLNMVQMNGDELCLKIREDLGLKELPVIFLSANDDRNTIITLFRMGATDYLNKPFLQEELMARIKAHLHREKLLSALRDVADIRSSSETQTSGAPGAENRSRSWTMTWNVHRESCWWMMDQ